MQKYNYGRLIKLFYRLSFTSQSIQFLRSEKRKHGRFFHSHKFVNAWNFLIAAKVEETTGNTVILIESLS